jgi:hypothetical protein
MLGVHHTILKEQRFGKGKADDQGRQLARIAHFHSSSFFLLPRAKTLVNFRRISRAISRALTDLDLSPSPDEVPIWDSEYYRLPVTVSVGGAFQPSITFPFAQRTTSH